MGLKDKLSMASEIIPGTLEEHVRRMTPISAPPEQREAVAQVLALLDAAGPSLPLGSPRCELVGPSGDVIPIPESVFYVLERVVEVLARGDGVTVVPVGKELTTQQAADLLSVSRQYLVRLLDEGRIPYSKTGKHRRIRAEDVLAFKETRDKRRVEALNDLTALSEELGGYEELE